MLEQRGLVLGPWSGSDPRQRIVCDADSGVRLGFVRAEGLRGWLRWLGGQVLRAFETEDASLLLTLARPAGWLRAWQLTDADNHPVATVHGQSLRDPHGFVLAVALPAADGGVRYVSPRGVELAVRTITARGVVLVFAAEMTNPFVRMALLGATLAATV